MANLLNKPFLTTQLPSLCFKRFRGKINIQRPRPPHFERAKVIAITTPVYPKKEQVRPCKELKYKQFKKDVDNPYENIIAREVKNWFDHSQMIAVFHVNPIAEEDFFKLKVAFHKSGMQLKKYGSGILKKAVVDTKYEALLGLSNNVAFSTAYVFCTGHKKVSTLLNVVKKVPQFNLLCGVVDDSLLSKNEFIAYSKLPSIDIVRSQFANVLHLAGNQIVQNLQSHQSNLVNILDAHVRVNEKPAEVPAEPTVDEPVK